MIFQYCHLSPSRSAEYYRPNSFEPVRAPPVTSQVETEQVMAPKRPRLTMESQEDVKPIRPVPLAGDPRVVHIAQPEIKKVQETIITVV